MQLATHTKTTSRNGSTRIKHFDDNPEGALVKIMEAHPRGRMPLAAYKRLIRDKADKIIFQDARFREALHAYCFQNMFNNGRKLIDQETVEEYAPPPPVTSPFVPPKHRPLKTAIERAAERAERERLTAEAAALAEAAIEKKARTLILDIVMPNGKRVAECTGIYLHKYGKAAGTALGKTIAEIGRRIGKQTPQDKGMTEDQAHDVGKALARK